MEAVFKMERDNQRQADVSALDASFMAGLFAGEGSICIVIGKFPNGESYPNMHAGFTTTEKCWSDWFHGVFGGHVHVYPPKTPRHKWLFFWRVGGGAAERFLKTIQPFLKGEKVQQLELALEYRDKKRELKASGGKISQNIELWESFRARLKALRVAAAETNRRDANAPRSDSPILEATPDK
jgi:hypothetical protein